MPYQSRVDIELLERFCSTCRCGNGLSKPGRKGCELGFIGRFGDRLGLRERNEVWEKLAKMSCVLVGARLAMQFGFFAGIFVFS